MLRGGARILHTRQLSTRYAQFFPMNLPLLAIVFSSLSLVGVLALTVAVWRVRNFSQAATIKHRFDEVESVLEAHGQWWKKLNANVASIRGAMKRQDSEESHESNGSTDASFSMRPGETPEQWKTRMRTALATGQIKPPR